jgi:DNA-cytosine methyltransferase
MAQINQNMTHGSLFSGIGGFDLAAEWMGWDNIFHCEWNPFGQKVLKHHFPNSISYNDITKTDFSIHANKIDILTGGFPCQPYSSAGKRLGKADERHLFPEMLRCIKEVKPRYIVGENVRGLVSWGGGWYSTRCAMIWKGKAMQYNRFLFLLQVSAHRTKDKEFGLLLTPTTKEDPVNLEKFKKRMEKYPNGTTMPNLATQVMEMLPTPNASDSNNANNKENHDVKRGYLRGFASMGLLPTPLASCMEQTNTEAYDKRMERLVEKGHHPFTMPLDQMAIRGLLPTPMASEGDKMTGSITENQMSLTKMVRQGMLPTPNSFDWNTARSEETLEKAKERHKEKGVVLQSSLRQIAGQGFQLSPLFVGEMMGFPKNWTTSPFLNGEKNQSKPTETP